MKLDGNRKFILGLGGLAVAGYMLSQGQDTAQVVELVKWIVGLSGAGNAFEHFAKAKTKEQE